MQYSKLSISAIVAVGAFVGVCAASAADLPARTYAKAAPMMVPVSNWTGCYIGGNVGAARDRTDVTDEVSGAPIASLNPTKIVGGGQIGCDYQFAGNWVIGIQGMYDGSDIQADATSASLAPLTLHGAMPWFATATVRLGYAVVPNLLVYAKGGGTWSHTDATLLFGNTQIDRAGFNQSGWTVGGGAEWMFAPNWSVFAEYDYLRFTDKVVSFPVTVNIGNVQQEAHVGLVGVNFRFSSLFR